MAFAKKMMGFPSDLVSFSTNCRQKDMRKSVSRFLQRNNENKNPSMRCYKDLIFTKGGVREN